MKYKIDQKELRRGLIDVLDNMGIAENGKFTIGIVDGMEIQIHITKNEDQFMGMSDFKVISPDTESK